MDSLVHGSMECEIPTVNSQLRSPIVNASDLSHENKVNMDTHQPNMPVMPEPSVFEDNPNLSSTEPSLTETIRMQNPTESTRNLLTKSNDMNYNLKVHLETHGYQKNSTLTNIDASRVRLPLAVTGYLAQKNVVNTNRNQSSMPNVLDLSGYRGNSFLKSTAEMNAQHSVSSSAAGPSKGNNESFVNMDISNMSSVAGPSGYGINSDVVSNDSGSLVTPIRAANDQYRYICQFCEYKTNKKSYFEYHIRVHTGERPFPCKNCHKCFKQKCDLKRHLRIHTGEKPYDSAVCEYKCSDASSMRNHTGYSTEKNFIDTNRNQSSMQVLDLSGYQGNSSLMSTEHLNTQHSVSSSAAGPSKGTQGSLVVRDISNMPTAAGPSGSESSALVSNDSESRVTSVRAANGQSKHICEFCGYEANRKSNLKDHIRVHTGERPFECKDCHRFYKTQSYLVKHIRMHSGEKPYVCDVCKYSSSYKSNMNRHKRNHGCE